MLGSCAVGRYSPVGAWTLNLTATPKLHERAMAASRMNKLVDLMRRDGASMGSVSFGVWLGNVDR
jgi:hypothetical protein